MIRCWRQSTIIMCGNLNCCCTDSIYLAKLCSYRAIVILDPHLYPSSLSLLPLKGLNNSVQFFMATWSSIHPGRVDNYSITVSPPPPSGSTTFNSSITLQLRNDTLYNITITTSYCHGISQDDTSSHFSIGSCNVSCFN